MSEQFYAFVKHVKHERISEQSVKHERISGWLILWINEVFFDNLSIRFAISSLLSSKIMYFTEIFS